jgi:hypothetical protein
MTMPFNVISLTTTIYAFIIGSVMNILIRRSSASINKALGKTEADVKSKINRSYNVATKFCSIIRRIK